MSEQSESSEDRALEPTERRLERAREQGQFPQSRDLTTLIVLGTFAAFELGLGSSLMDSLVRLARQGLTFSSAEHWQDHFTQWMGGPLLASIFWLLALMLPIWLISILAPLALVKFRPVFALRLNASRLDPVAGLGRMFSGQTLNELLKNLLKVIVIFGIGILYLYSLLGNLNVLAHQDMKQGLANSLHLIETGFLLLLLPTMVVALVDVTFQWFNFQKRMRMSPEELKQEMKESEGSPELRARLRQRQRQIAGSRMMAALERADVVLANPDHYAVALRYDPEKMVAPIVVAKGVDELALQIQAIARQHHVPVAHIPPLARLLHQHLKVGQPIPAQLFEAVAKVLAWAYELKENTAQDPGLPDVGTLPDLRPA